MGNIESALNDRIDRRARQQVKAQNIKLLREVKRLRERLAKLSTEVVALKTQTKALARNASRPTAEAAAAPSAQIRLSPKLIVALRKRLGVSQAQLAQLLDASPNAVYQWESGRSAPRQNTRLKIAALRGLGRREVKRRLAA